VSNWSIKRIGKYFYLYSFRYKPVLQRTKRKKRQRFEWKYHGKIGSAKANKFIRGLPSDEQDKIFSQFKQKDEEFRQLEELAKTLEVKEPFIHQKNEIYKIECIKEQHNAIRRFQNKLLTVAKIQLDKKQ
jgi:hypothetical protein